MKEYNDGWCYESYLWDDLKNKQIVSENFCRDFLKECQSFDVFWDLHSNERVLIANDWNFSKEEVLQLPFEAFEIYQSTFPEDIYLVDDSFSWTTERIENTA